MKVLLFGSQGDEVVKLQKLLLASGEMVSTDGKFGILTRDAVKRFQKKCGLIPDGIVGPKTWAWLSRFDNIDYKYDILSNGLHIVRIDPMKLKIVMEPNTGAKTKLKNAVNGSFVWWKDSKKIDVFATSIVVYDGKVLHNAQPNGYTWQPKPHYPTGAPTPVFIIYKDGAVTVEDKNYIKPEEAIKIHLAVTGIDLLPMVRSTGFEPHVPFSGVSYKTNRIAIGYDSDTKEVILAFRKLTTAQEMSKYMKLAGCEKAISLDSGGSANFIVDGVKINGTTRKMITWITW